MPKRDAPKTRFWIAVMGRINRVLKREDEPIRDTQYVRDLAAGLKYNKSVSPIIEECMTWATKKTGVRP